MNVRKFHASSTREALRLVRDALGADAIILGNRQIPGGIEIMAVADQDVSSLTQVQPQAQSVSAAALEKPSMQPPPRPAAPTEKLAPTAIPAEAMPDPLVKDIAREIKFLRGMVEGQLAGFAWGDLQRHDPAKVEILRTMLSVGLSPVLSRQLLGRLPADYDFNKGLRWLKLALTHNLHVFGPDDDIIDRGGVYALVGPTGVGKTTTVAKLAARCTLKHGASSVAMLTTDSYRIGAHEQLRIYGKILGVPVYAIKDETDLQLTLSDLHHKHLVLVDTVGMSHRDRRVAEQVALLSGRGRSVKRLLLLNAAAQGSTLEDVVQSYQGQGDSRLSGGILTKIDEAGSLGGVLDVIIRHRLTLSYVTNGQRVPEDMHLANAHYLVDRAFKLVEGSSPFAMDESEYPLIMASGSDDANWRNTGATGG
ncbi:MAG: flagellar biosynthesis protein FlhF [Burkholderiales bacterium]